MFRAMSAVAVVGLSLLSVPSVRADATTDAIVEKAIKAHGGADKLDKHPGAKSRSKGTLELMGMTLNMTQESITSKGRFKETVELEVAGQSVKIITGHDGKNPWVNANGMDVPVDDNTAKELNEAVHLIKLGRYTTLKDKSIELTSLGESKVDGKTVVGIKVASKDRRDVEFFFDKDSGLLLKVQRMVYDMAAGKEVTEERFIKEYHEVEGMKVAKKVLINRDDKKYVEMEVEEFKPLEKVEDNTFDKP